MKNNHDCTSCGVSVRFVCWMDRVIDEEGISCWIAWVIDEIDEEA